MSTGSSEPGSAGLSTSTDGRWAPFPVQDWSTMPPADPVRPAPAEPGRRRDPLPLLIMLVVLAVVCGAIYVADRQGLVTAESSASRYVPADGTATYAMRTLSGSEPVPVITETARFAAGQISLALDFTLGSEVLGAVDLHLAGQAFWRTTTTNALAPNSAQQTRVYTVGRSVALLAESWPGRALIFHPGVVQLPDGVQSGSRWQGSGTAGKDLIYQSSYSARSAPGGCLRVVGEIRFLTVAGASRGTRSDDDTWCPGRGVVLSSETMDELTTTAVAVDRIDVESVPVTTTSPIHWSDPSGWRSRSFAAVSVDPTFGEGPVSGTPADRPPVITESGLVFRVVTGVDDLLAFGPYANGTWRSLWRLHPGGRVLSTAAFGNVVVASTSRRQVVAYTDQGRRLWTLGLDELAFAAPVRLSATTLAVVDLAGSIVAVDIATGALRWRATTGSGVPTPPAVAGDGLVVGDGSGAVTAYDVTDGSLRWQQEIDQYHGAAAAGEVVVLIGEQTVNGVGVRDGRRRWMKPFRGTYQSITAFTDAAVLTSRAGSYLVGADGTIRPLARAYQLLTCSDDRAVGWGSNRAEVLDRTGRVLAGRDIPPLTVTSGARDAVATPDGVLLLGTDWSVDSWGR